MSEKKKSRQLPSDVLKTLDALDHYAGRSMVTKQIRHHLDRLRDQLVWHYGGGHVEDACHAVDEYMASLKKKETRDE